mgnify:FL=1
MRRSPTRNPRKKRSAVAAVELAILLPILLLFFAIAVDYSRISYHAVTVTNCARNGALYLCDPMNQQESKYESLEEATLADATDLTPQPTVTSSSGTDDEGHDYVEVTVSYPFKPVMSYLGLGSTVNVQRTIRMRKAPLTP